MRRMLAVLPLLTACLAMPQDPGKPPGAADQQARPSPTANKDQLDGLIRGFRNAALKNGALGEESCRTTAQVLAGAGNSHRFYHAGDGPWIRNGLRFLFTRRAQDGSFRDANDADAVLTTRWVLAALEVMDPNGHATEIKQIRDWLVRKPAPATSAFDDLVQELGKLEDPVGHGKELAQRAAKGMLMQQDGAPDFAASADVLVRLAALQALGRSKSAPAGGEGPKAAGGEWRPAQQKGVDFLLAHTKDGAVVVKTPGGDYPSVELTGLGLTALLSKPKALRNAAEQQAIGKGLEWLLAQQNEDGSFGFTTLNYTTSSAIAALTAATEPRYQAALGKAQRFLLGLQHTEEKGFERSDRDYGSIGYGGSERGDLSNLQFALEGLRGTGLSSDHEAFRRAIVFLQRTQNLKEVNDFKGPARNPDEGGAWQTFRSGDDGGAAYFPGNSPAGYLELEDGSKIPRSYGSMTYALLKAYTLCGVGKDDRRVQAAAQWLARNWSLTENPGSEPKLGEKNRYQGLYYYYMVMAQALDIAGIDRLGEGATAIDWRVELRAHLEKSQQQDGSWVNDKNDRWWEGQPVLCTIYCLLALQRCQK